MSGGTCASSVECPGDAVHGGDRQHSDNVITPGWNLIIMKAYTHAQIKLVTSPAQQRSTGVAFPLSTVTILIYCAVSDH